ncbi:hypothetical protein TNCV_3591971 [Trichonephila clavipes]|nr:hypothetical protein TNCV_3591971 [Trichonephila clavipes]
MTFYNISGLSQKFPESSFEVDNVGWRGGASLGWKSLWGIYAQKRYESVTCGQLLRQGHVSGRDIYCTLIEQIWTPVPPPTSHDVFLLVFL